MSMEWQWWRKTKVLAEKRDTVSLCLPKRHIDWPVIEPVRLCWETCDKPLELSHSPVCWRRACFVEGLSVFLQVRSFCGAILTFFFRNGSTAPSGPRPHYRGFTITFRHTTFGRTPLHEWSARRRDLYLTSHNTHNRQTSNPQSQQASGRRPTP
jgi:hypothetical protein